MDNLDTVNNIYCVVRKTDYEYSQQKGIDVKVPQLQSLKQRMYENHQRHQQFLHKFKEVIQSLNLQVKIVNSSDINTINPKKNDLVISCGGDGTFLSCAQCFPNSILLGMNSNQIINKQGSIGALTYINYRNLEICLKSLADNNYYIELWNRLTFTINGKPINKYAINDIYIGNKLSYLTCNILVSYQSVSEDFNCSGLIACTGMGSHAWHASAGGRTFSNQLDAFAFMVLLPSPKWNPRFSNGMLYKNDQLIVIPHRDGYIISVDSRKDTISLQAGDELAIFISHDNPLRVLNFN